MKTYKTSAEITAGGTLVLRELPFQEGEQVSITIASPAAFSAMHSYAEKMAPYSGEFVSESGSHVAERLLRETEW